MSIHTHTHIHTMIMHRVDYYIQNKFLSSYKLYTIMNESCKSITFYHIKNNKGHGNTTLANFMVSDDDCVGIKVSLGTGIEDANIALDKYDDYDRFFASYHANIQYKNKHFDKILYMYKKSFTDSIS